MGEPQHDPYPDRDDPSSWERPDVEAPGMALEGEIVVYRPYPGSDYSYADRGRARPRNVGPDIGHGHHDEHGNPRRGDRSEQPRDRPYGPGERFGPRSYEEGLVREVVAYTVTHPNEGLRRIAARFGVSTETVRRWTRGDVDKRSSAVDTPKLRAEAAIHLEAERTQAWEIFQQLKDALAMGVGQDDDPPGRRTAALPHPTYLKALMDALGKVESATAVHAKLLGLYVPVKVDVQITALTEAERELQEMINEAKTRTAAMEAAVIAEASEDPDL